MEVLTCGAGEEGAGEGSDAAAAARAHHPHNTASHSHLNTTHLTSSTYVSVRQAEVLVVREAVNPPGATRVLRAGNVRVLPTIRCPMPVTTLGPGSVMVGTSPLVWTRPL